MAVDPKVAGSSLGQGTDTNVGFRPGAEVHQREAELPLLGLNGRWRSAPTWSAMLRLPDAGQKNRAERQDSIFIGPDSTRSRLSSFPKADA